MTVLSRILGKYLKLQPARTYDLVVERDIEVPMPDGVVLLADHYYPRKGDKCPTILIRTPYGRRGYIGLLYGRLVAERGFQVLVQSCRGTFGSGGQFIPFLNDHADGVATIDWIKKQKWFTGDLATIGGSYLGFVQWAMARSAGSVLKAMSTHISASEFRDMHYPGESFSFYAALEWTTMIATQETTSLVRAMLFGRDKMLKPSLMHLPLQDAVEVAIGKPMPHWQDWLDHNKPDDDYWTPADFRKSVAEVTAPVIMLAGWYDIFTPWQLRDYAALRGAGRKPYLTIGSWTHADLKAMGTGVREGIDWFRAHLLGDPSGLREEPVRLFVMGVDEWRDFPDYPPPGSRPQRWYLQSDSGLAVTPPVESEPDQYRYDPADPTPAVGGTLLLKNAGPMKNNKLEARSDVLVYTSAALEQEMEVIGSVRAELYVQSSLEYTDFFARVCDVEPSGKSINICDGILRLVPGRPAPEPDGCIRANIDLWPTAYRFRRGHRIRVQVSSGSHPRFARNPGSGEPLATATKLLAADQTVYHDPARPSGIIFMVME
ncbi:MAG: CocE/NonD family hydrolase [Promethearchaeota archaeon]